MPYANTPRCPRCKRWLGRAGDRHICVGELRRCANPRCRRLLPFFPRRDVCMRCALLGTPASGADE